jgi:hypothetical protein
MIDTEGTERSECKCRVIDSRLYSYHAWIPINLNSPANAKWKEAWCNFPVEIPGYIPDGHYNLVKRGCRYFSQGDDGNDYADQCDKGQLFHPYSCGDQKLYKPCPACANNVEPGYRYELEPVKNDL